MSHRTVKFAINRTVAPRLPLDGFLALAKTAGAAAVEVRNDVGGAGPLQICYDTFQFCRAGVTNLYPQLIGLVHVSGISRTDPPPENLTETDRGFVDTGDVTDTAGQRNEIIARGYRGYVSIEPFAPAIHAADDVSGPLARSLAFLRPFT